MLTSLYIYIKCRLTSLDWQSVLQVVGLYTPTYHQSNLGEWPLRGWNAGVSLGLPHDKRTLYYIHDTYIWKWNPHITRLYSLREEVRRQYNSGWRSSSTVSRRLEMLQKAVFDGCRLPGRTAGCAGAAPHGITSGVWLLTILMLTACYLYREKVRSPQISLWTSISCSKIQMH